MAIDKAKALELASQGKTVRQMCDELGCTSRTLYDATYTDPVFAREFARARQEGLELQADDLMTVADQAQDVLRARLKSENLRWLLSRRLPAQYGDKLALDVSGQIDLVGVLEEARRRVRPISDQSQPEALQVIDAEVITLPRPADSETVATRERGADATDSPSIFD